MVDAVADDAYITLAYGAEWASGGGLQHPSGERSEGFSVGHGCALGRPLPWWGRTECSSSKSSAGGGTVVRGASAAYLRQVRHRERIEHRVAYASRGMVG